METTTTQKKNKTPKLVCIVTGAPRNTTREYLDSRLARLNISEEVFVAHYANKNTINLLREGKSVDQIRKMTGSTAANVISPEMLKKILAFNGKQPRIKIEAKKAEKTVNSEQKKEAVTV